MIRQFLTLPTAVRGALLMIGAALSFALLAVTIRICSGEIHPFEIVFFRNLFGLVFMLPWLLQGAGIRQLTTKRRGLYILRAVLGLAAMQSFFWALTAMPVAGVVAISFSTPLFITVGAALVLGEIVHCRRWAATLIGFGGMLLILRPGTAAMLHLPAVVALFSAVAMAGSALVIKLLSRTEPSRAIVTWMVILMTPLAFPPALWVWEWPSISTWFLLVLTGALGTVGHLCLTAAMKTADASYVMPFDIIRLPAVAFLAWLLFGETIDYWTWLGTGVIFAATIYSTHWEARLQILDDAEKIAVVERPP